MRYLDWCRQNDIMVMPIKLKIYHNAEGKLVKKFQDRADVRWFKDFNDGHAKIQRRWARYDANGGGFTHFAVDTSKIAIIDVDCVLEESNEHQAQIFRLMLEHPFKISNTKSYGKHIIIATDNIPDNSPDRFGLDKRFGVQNNQPGVEILAGQWQWAKLDDDIQNVEKGIKIWNDLPDAVRPLAPAAPALPEPETSPPPAPIAVATAVAVACDEQPSPIDLQAVRDNLNAVSDTKIRSPTTCSGIIKALACSNSEDVYQILLERLSRPNCNFSNETWVRQRWDAAPMDSNIANYRTAWETSWSQNKKKYNFTRFLEDANKLFQDEFYNKYKKNFLVNLNYKCENRRVAFFDEKNSVWKEGKGIAKSQIIFMIRKEYDNLRSKLLSGYALLPSDDPSSAEYKEMVHGAIKRFLCLFSSTGGWTNGTANHILSMIQHTPELQKNIQYNLEPITQHYFQFRNGAMNLKTGILEARTREMYITKGMVLDYDYVNKPYVDETKKLNEVFDKIFGFNEAKKESWLHWRGYCLTGSIREQKAMIKIGIIASNGKSTDSKCFNKCFNIYCDKVGNDAFNSGGAYNKCFSKFAGRPIRLFFLEEWGKDELNTELIKATIESETLTVKPLYQEEINMIIQGKMEAQTNHHPNFGKDIDKGILRRFGMEDYGSEFVDKEEEERCCDEEHIYLKEDIEALFDDVNYRCAYFNMFLPYAMKYYNEGGLKCFYRCNQVFKKFVGENYDYEWVEDYFEQTEIEEDRFIYRDRMLEIFQEKHKNIQIKEIKAVLAAQGIKYDTKCELAKNHQDNITNSRKKGYFVNVKCVDFYE